jgi:hypothetical protein
MTEEEQRRVVSLLAAETDEQKVAAFLAGLVDGAWAAGYQRGRADEAIGAPNKLLDPDAQATTH